jgi:hypothetical protein
LHVGQPAEVLQPGVGNGLETEAQFHDRPAGALLVASVLAAKLLYSGDRCVSSYLRLNTAGSWLLCDWLGLLDNGLRPFPKGRHADQQQ